MPDGEELRAVFDHYLINVHGSGERRISCPLIGHDDAHASASVNLGKGLWNCHACGGGGTAVDIVMERENLEYGPARKFLDEIVGTSDSGVRGGTSEFFTSRRVSSRKGPGRPRRAYSPPWGRIDSSAGT